MFRSILSINGNKSMNFLLKTVLSPNYKFIAVSDVYQAMAELKRLDNVDFIITDLDYHTDENVDFIQHIQTSSLYPGIHFIVLSSNKGYELKPELNLLDCHFFYKPFSPIDMVTKLDKLVKENYQVLS